MSEEIAGDLGMEYSLTLNGTDEVDASQHRIHRILIGSDMRLPQFVMAVRKEYSPEGVRAAHVDLDYVYDPDPEQQEKNLGLLLDRVKAMKLSTVILQAYADPDGNGAADALYFPNRHLPMKADLFNRTAWQLRTRAGVEVFAWLPVLSFELGDEYDQHPTTHLARHTRDRTEGDGPSPSADRIRPTGLIADRKAR